MRHDGFPVDHLAAAVGRGTRLTLATAALACVTIWLAAASTAQAASGGLDWVITAQGAPSYFAPGDTADQYILTVTDDGGQATDGSPITITDTLPTGVTATAIEGGLGGIGNGGVSCELPTVTCTATRDPSGRAIAVVITVAVSNSASGTLSDQASVSGGGGQAVSTTAQTPVSTAPVPYGFAYFQTQVLNDNGTAETQAGSHPFELTTAFGLNISGFSSLFGTAYPAENAEARDIDVALPPGLVGDPSAVPQCSQARFQGAYGFANCPGDSQVGLIHLFFYAGGSAAQTYPVYNVAPPPGQPAEFGFTVAGFVHVPIFFKVRTGSDYGLTAVLAAIPETLPVQSSVMTLWGNPADPAHDSLRYPEGATIPGARSGAAEKPLLTYPTDCQGGAMTVTASSDSWSLPGTFEAAPASLPAPTGCDGLTFQPSLSVAPDNLNAGQPTGLQVDVHVPQADDPNSLATPELRNATVTVPQGMVINPGSADGLQGCTDAEIALTSEAAATCPQAAQIGTVQVTTPLLPGPLTGQVYLGTPRCSPCTSADAQSGKMVRLFIQAQGFGVTIKLPGTVTVNPATGQLTATFNQNPQLPFTDLVVTFKGGPRAPIADPRTCGAFITTSDLSPWSSPFTPDATPSSSFDITGCGNPNTFAPSFSAGSVNAQAGAYSPFTLKFSRTDADQFFSGLTATLPAGMVAKLAGVPLCSSSDANVGTCPAASRVGSATIASGPGSEPLWIPQTGAPQPGVYLTGAYRGAPYGLVVETPAIAGPFNLGMVVVRQALYIDPTTAEVTVRSDPFPTVIDGIPLQIRTVSVRMDRPGFTVNPTSCDPTAVTGVLSSTSGLSEKVSSRFQVANCGNLPFKPTLRAETHAYHSRKTGSYLKVTIAAKAGEANLARVHLTLPKQLPAQLETLKQACSQAQFAANPAGCPQASFVGSVVVHTPVLAKPLTGPAIYVAHGAAKLPNLAFVLQSEGVTIIQEGITKIRKDFTSSSFDAIPDVPVASIEVTLPEGSKPALGGNTGNLCFRTVIRRVKRRTHGRIVYRKRDVKRRLTLFMPTTIAGQNGAVIHQETKMTVKGCGHGKIAKHMRDRNHAHHHRQHRKHHKKK